MKKLFQGAVLYILSCSTLFVLPGCKQKNEKVLVVALSPDYPPFEFYTKEGKLTGVDVELIQELARHLKKDVVFKPMDFSAILPAIEKGLADVGVSTITLTPEREQRFDFSIPYYKESLAVVFPKDSPIHSIQDMRGKKIGCQMATTMEHWLQQNSFEATTMDDNNQIIEALKAGHIDIAFLDEAQARSFCQASNGDLSYKVIARSDAGYAVAMLKGSALRLRLNTALQNMIKSGDLEKILKKYNLSPGRNAS